MEKIKEFLKRNNINAYLICDFNGNAKNGRSILNFEAYTTRRVLLYWG